MGEKKKIDYIYFRKSVPKRRRVRFFEKQEAGISILEAEVMSDLKEKMLKRMKKGFKRYQLDHVVVGADGEMSEQLGIQDGLFQARKKELIEHQELIFRHMKTDAGINRRSSAMIVLESRKWKKKEILALLVTAKDYFEELSVFSEEDYIDTGQLAESLYEEWGVVLHILKKGEEPEQKQDFILFLLEEWNKEIVVQYRFCNAYLVLEAECRRFGRDRIERLDTEKEHCIGKRRLYAGLVYEKEGKRLSYQMAVDIFYQNPVRYQDFNISIVAIYLIE